MYFKKFKLSNIIKNKKIFKTRYYCTEKEEDKFGKARIFISTTNDPFFNLATEHYMFKHLDLTVPIMFLWRNSANVVIGKNQNPWVECQVQQMEKDGLSLVRRDSGGEFFQKRFFFYHFFVEIQISKQGGAVYQDLGNSCFTFLSKMGEHNKERNTNIICRTLKNHFGIDAKASGRNDIVVGERKVSGSAYKYNQERALHHGTLLIDVNLSALEKYLTPNKKKLESKGKFLFF